MNLRAIGKNASSNQTLITHLDAHWTTDIFFMTLHLKGHLTTFNVDVYLVLMVNVVSWSNKILSVDYANRKAEFSCQHGVYVPGCIACVLLMPTLPWCRVVSFSCSSFIIFRVCLSRTSTAATHTHISSDPGTGLWGFILLLWNHVDCDCYVLTASCTTRCPWGIVKIPWLWLYCKLAHSQSEQRSFVFEQLCALWLPRGGELTKPVALLTPAASLRKHQMTHLGWEERIVTAGELSFPRSIQHTLRNLLLQLTKFTNTTKHI